MFGPPWNFFEKSDQRISVVITKRKTVKSECERKNNSHLYTLLYIQHYEIMQKRSIFMQKRSSCARH